MNTGDGGIKGSEFGDSDRDPAGMSIWTASSGARQLAQALKSELLDRGRSALSEIEQAFGNSRSLAEHALKEILGGIETRARDVRELATAQRDANIMQIEKKRKETFQQIDAERKHISDTHGTETEIVGIEETVSNLLTDADPAKLLSYHRIRSAVLGGPSKTGLEMSATTADASEASLEDLRAACKEATEAGKSLRAIMWPDHDFWTDAAVVSVVWVVCCLGLGLGVASQVHGDWLRGFLFLSIVSTAYFTPFLIARRLRHARVLELHSQLLLRCKFAKELLHACRARLFAELTTALSSLRRREDEAAHQAVTQREEAENRFRDEIAALESEKGKSLHQARAKCEATIIQATSAHAKDLLALKTTLQVIADAKRRDFADFDKSLGFGTMAWTDEGWEVWQQGSHPEFAVRFGTVAPAFSDEDPFSNAFAGIADRLSLPSIVPFSEGKCLLIEAPTPSRSVAVALVQTVMLRLFATVPPGQLRFTLLDPVGLGQNAGGYTMLRKIHPELIDSQAWADPRHIEERLSVITDEMMIINQDKLRNTHASILDYNRTVPYLKQPYRVLVVFDFPANFTDKSGKELLSIISSGPRCGVFTIVVRDPARQMPHGFKIDDLRHSSTLVSMDENGIPKWYDETFGSWFLKLDSSPSGDLAKRVVETVGQQAKSANRGKIPLNRFLEMASITDKSWTEESTDSALSAPLGLGDDGNVLSLQFGGDGTSHHGLLIGQTGAGKTELLHTIITMLAMRYSPSEIQLYLVDLKGGVGFKRYAENRLPHAAVVAVASEREFGWSVLQGIDAEFHRRTAALRAVNAHSVAEYRQRTRDANQAFPRILVIIDEFQELFMEEDQIASESAIFIERIVKEGRQLGIHLLLATQSLSGRLKLTQSTLNQMAVRIVLQCSEEDARLLLRDPERAPQLRGKGHGIYNDNSGVSGASREFQALLIEKDDWERELPAIRQLASGIWSGSRQIIFEGDKAASIEQHRCIHELGPSSMGMGAKRRVQAWLGEPIAVQDATIARFRRLPSSNLLVVIREEEEGIGVVAASILTLLRQLSAGAVRFRIVDYSAAETPWEGLTDELAMRFPESVSVVPRGKLTDALNELVQETRRRRDLPSVSAEPEVFFVLFGIQRIRELRVEAEAAGGFSLRSTPKDVPPAPAQLLAEILREGGELGIHVIGWGDAFGSIRRTLARGVTMADFAMRVAGPMSGEDSRQILDNPAAGRLAKPYRAFFIDDEQAGQLGKFRPFAAPSLQWIRSLEAGWQPKPKS